MRGAQDCRKKLSFYILYAIESYIDVDQVHRPKGSGKKKRERKEKEGNKKKERM